MYDVSMYQSAYRKHHSYETSLLKLYNGLILSRDKNLSTMMVLLDLSAAFDTVDHKILLDGLNSVYGFGGDVLTWFASYLTNRTFSVHLQNNSSTPICLDCGVPQGSVLGPIVFTLHTSPLLDHIHDMKINVLAYADDMQLYLSCENRFIPEAVTKMQACLEFIRS